MVSAYFIHGKRAWAMLLLAVSGWLFIRPVGAQDERRRIDSLERVLAGAPAPVDTILYDVCTQLAGLYRKADLAKATDYVQRSIELADRIGDPAKRADGRRRLADLYRLANRLDDQQRLLKQALSLLDGCVDASCAHTRYRCAFDLAICYEDRGRMQAAVAALAPALEAPALAEGERANGLTQLGILYYELGNYDTALEQYRKAIEIGVKADGYAEGYNYGGTLYNMTNIYGVLNNHDRVKELTEELLRYGRETNSKRYLYLGLGRRSSNFELEGRHAAARRDLLHMLRLAEEMKNDVYIAQMMRFLIDNDPGPASAPYARRAERMLADSLPLRIYEKSDLYLALAKYYQTQENYPRARDYALQRVNYLANMAGDTSRLALEAREYLTQLQAATGDYAAAWRTYDELYHMKLTQVERHHQEALARTAVDMELADHERARLAAEEKTRLEQQAAAARMRLFIIILVFAGLILAVIAWAYRRAQRDKHLIAEQNASLEQSLGEKEVLLREIHHRVKNNLQIISSLLDKQARTASDASVRQLVREGQKRIHSMALVHQNLYQSDQLSGIDMRSYLEELGRNIRAGQDLTDRAVELLLDVTDEKLDIDTAIPVGLILNELITNAYKYAFQDRREGRIEVEFQRRDAGYALRVSDDGVGLPEDFGEKRKSSLGHSLVRGLVRQLGGSVEWRPARPGTTVMIQF